MKWKMRDEASMSDNELKNGYEWHLEFPYAPDYPYPFPIVPAGTRDKHDAVGHLSTNGRVHVFNCNRRATCACWFARACVVNPSGFWDSRSAPRSHSALLRKLSQSLQCRS